MSRPQLQELTPDLQKIFDPEKSKMLPFIARGAAPLPPPLMVSAWCYLMEEINSDLADTARNSLLKYPDKMLIPVLQSELPAWVLGTLGKIFQNNDEYLEAILLNEHTPDELFIDVSKTCSEKISNLIANNQERIIDKPEIIKSLEANPNNLKSNTEKLRHFLQLAGVRIPGEAVSELDLMKEDAFELDKNFLEAVATGAELTDTSKILNDEQKLNLIQFMAKLTVGGKIKLALKGNKEVRGILIRDTTKLVALAVLKSPRITENEVAHYTGLKSLSEDVVRAIAFNVGWVKNYNVKLGLCYHPKTPLQYSMAYIKFLNLRDLQRITKDRNIPGPLGKAARELLKVKRK